MIETFKELNIYHTFLKGKKFLFCVEESSLNLLKDNDFFLKLNNGTKIMIESSIVKENNEYWVTLDLKDIFKRTFRKGNIYCGDIPILLAESNTPKFFLTIGTCIEKNYPKKLTISVQKNKQIKVEKKQKSKQQNNHKKIKTALICFDLKQVNKNISFLIPKNYISENKLFKLAVKKRKEDTIFYLEYTCSEKKDFYCFEIDLEQFSNLFSGNARLDLFGIVNEQNSEQRIYNVYKNNTESSFRYFESIELTQEKSISCYRNKNNQISFVLNTYQNILNETLGEKVYLKSISLNSKGVFRLEVTMSKYSNLQMENLVFTRRKSIDEEKFEIESIETTYTDDKKHFLFIIDITEYIWGQFYWDVSLKMHDEQLNNYYLKIKNNSLWNKLKLQYTITKNTFDFENGYILLPYITASEELSINYRLKGEYEANKYKRNERIAYFLYIFFGWFFMRQKIWLIHEKFSETAQDNSFYFFNYCYKFHKKKRVYYVIKKESKDYIRLKDMEDRVVHFMSIRHLFLLLVSKRIISSEAKGHGYAWRVSKGNIRPVVNQKPYIFLQHGVLGLKMIDNTFKANGMNHANLFVASSDFEKKIIKDYLGYADNEVIITGLSRWDNLYEHQNQNKENTKKNIFFMPTWRNWLEEVPDSSFLSSDYYINYSHLIQSEKLNEWLKDKNIILNFYLHPKFVQFSNLFHSKSENIRIISFGERPVNQLLIESELLITDYSSIAWEAYYQNKPTLFYQFDIEEYETFQGSYLDLEKDLFGPVYYKEEELIRGLQQIEKQNFKMDEQYIGLKKHYFKYIDNRNSNRIYQAILEYEKKQNWKTDLIYKLKRSPLARTMWRKLKQVYYTR